MFSPGTPGFYLFWSVWSINSKGLVYGRGTSYPFFFLHQPVIIIIAFYVVQWDTGILPKLLVVVIGSFLVALVLIELLIRPFKPVRRLFGMKARGRTTKKA
jgi:peptidoglycan/LPS O-acetylase OafA/YrhL